MTLDELAARLNAKRAGRGYSARCPAHEDSSPSLSINPARNGGIVLHCHAGCSPTDVCRALGLTLADLQPDGPDGQGPHQNGANGKPTIAATYDYTDAAGTLLFQVVRFQPKAFRQRRPDGTGGWTWNLGDTERPLYRLPALTAAILTGETVYVVEGEKDVATLELWGLTATTCPGGAGKWRPEHTATLAGAHVVLIPDADGPGQRHAEAVQKALQGTVASLRTLTLPQPAKDVTEWATGYQGSREALRDLLARPPAPPTSRNEDDKGDDPPDYHLTDMGNGERFAHRHRGQFRYCFPFGRWYRYADGHWQEDTAGHAHAAGKATMREALAEAIALPESGTRTALLKHALRSQSAGKIDAMLTMAQSEPGIPVEPGEWDAQPHLLNLANGTLDLRTEQLRPHAAADLITTKLPYRYDPQATCPQWDAFLSRAFDGHADMLDFIARAVGYSLTGTSGEQCFFFLHGSGANGKSVFLRTLLALFGNAGRTANFSTFLHQRDGGRPRQDLARLAGARLVVAAEAGEGQRFDEELLKSITGGERITARKLYAEDFEFTPQFTLWLAANHRPTIRGADLAIWRRVCLVPFAVTIPEEERIHLDTFCGLLAAELPGILNWALAGHRDWQERGLCKPASVIMATESYRDDSDPLRDFLETKCVLSPQCSVKAAALYAAYKDWCQESGESSRSQTWLGGQLRDRGYHSVKSHGTTTYIGLSLRSGRVGIECAESA